MIAFKGAVVLALIESLAAIGDSLNVYLNLFTILLVVGAALPVIKSRRKDATIRDLEEAMTAKAALAEERAEQLRQLEQGCQHLKTEGAEWKARYEEQSRYTAESAITHFEELMDEHRGQVAERHGQLLQLAQTTATALEGVCATLERLENRQN